jgi:hypothetical protein
MLAVRGFGQLSSDQIDESGGVWGGGWDVGGPILDSSGAGVNTPGTTMGGAGASGVLSVLNTIISDGAAVARTALTPTAKIAGPYGVSTIPIGGSVTPSGLMMGSGLSLGGISPTMLLIGAGLLVVMMMAGSRH